MLIPNFRNVKPTIQYLNLRCRIFGRERVAHEFLKELNNAKNVNFPEPIEIPELAEVYLNGLRQLDGYTIRNDGLTFAQPKTGLVTVLADAWIVDENLPWLRIKFNDFVDHKSVTDSAYSTDRRTVAPNVKTKMRPVVMIQPRIGFCRPSTYLDELLYCPRFGIYGRDSITYALLTDGGQISEMRCINIKVRDPNYVPYIRGRLMAAAKTYYKINGEEHSNIPTGNGDYVSFSAMETGVEIIPANPTSLNSLEQEIFLVIEGRDEDGDYYDMDEFADAEEIQWIVEGAKSFTVSLAQEQIYTTGNLLRIKIDRVLDTKVDIKLIWRGNIMYEATIKADGAERLVNYYNISEVTQPLFSIEPYDPLTTHTGISSPTASTLNVTYRNEFPISVLYDYDIEFTHTYRLPESNTPFKQVVAFNKTINSNVSLEETPLIQSELLWQTNNRFSKFTIVEPVSHFATVSFNYVALPPIDPVDPEPEEPIED